MLIPIYEYRVSFQLFRSTLIYSKLFCIPHALWLFALLRCFVFSPSLPFLILSRSLLCGVTRLNPLRTQPSPFFFCPRCCSVSLLWPPLPLLHSWCRCRAFPPTSSPQPMAQAALGTSAQGNHIPLLKFRLKREDALPDSLGRYLTANFLTKYTTTQRA